MMGNIKLTSFDKAKIIELNTADPQRWTRKALSEWYDVSYTTIFYILNPHGQKRRYESQEDERRAQTQSVNFRQQVERDALPLIRAIPKDTRDLTASIAGDPLPGRSALDQQRKRDGLA